MIRLIVVVIVACISLSEACSCIPRTNKEKYCSSDFAGVIAVQTSGFGCGNYKCYGIDVLVQLRGTPINPYVLRTSISSAACGVSLIPGHIYFVGSSVLNSAVLGLNLCQLYEDWTWIVPEVVTQKIQDYQRTRCFAIGQPLEYQTDSTHVCHVPDWQIYGYAAIVGFFEPCGVQSVKVINGNMKIYCTDPALAVDNLIGRFPSISLSVRYLEVDLEPVAKIIKRRKIFWRSLRIMSHSNGVALQPASGEVASSLVRNKSSSARHRWSRKGAIVLKGTEGSGVIDKTGYDKTIKKSNLYSNYHDESIVCPYDDDCDFNNLRHRTIRTVSDHIVRDHKVQTNAQIGPKEDFYIQWDQYNLQRYLQSPNTYRFVIYGFTSQRKSEMALSMSEGKWIDDMTELCRSVSSFKRTITVMDSKVFFESCFGVNAFRTLQTKALESKMDLQCKDGVKFISVETEPLGDRLLYYCIATERMMKCYVGSTVQTLNARFADHCTHNKKIRELLSASDVMITVFAMADPNDLSFDYERVKAQLEYVTIAVFDDKNGYVCS